MSDQIPDDLLAVRDKPLELLERVKAQLSPDDLEALRAQATADYGRKRFIPQPGPQEMAYHCTADVMLYGGAAGGGKSALLIGKAYTKHKRSLICRRQYTDMGELIRFTLEDVHRSRTGYRGDPPMRLTMGDGRQIEFFAAAQLGDEQHRQGQPVDFIGIDEASQWLEEQVVYLRGWNRSAEGIQCQVVLASNPPMSAEGTWLIQWFAPWLDPNHPNPALPGELRYFVRGEDDKWKETPDAEPVPVGRKQDGSPRMVKPESRTFIPSKLDNNIWLANTGYNDRLANMPAHIRRALQDGDFNSAREDHDKQLIPTAWITAAQERWKPEPPDAPMCSLGVDVAQGGAHSTVIARRYNYWIDRLVEVPGKETPLGGDVAALIFKHRRNNALVIIDADGGYGLGAIEHMQGNSIPYVGFKGGSGTAAKTKAGGLKFVNKRAEAWWRLYELLDPGQEGGSPIALPPDSGLKDDLASIRLAPNKDPTARGIQIESKDEIRKRLGRSPDKGDAVVMAFSDGVFSNTHYRVWKNYAQTTSQKPKVVQGYENRRRYR